MSVPSEPLTLRFNVFVRDHEHFEAMNDFICFNRHLIKDFTWYHGYVGYPEDSCVTVEFFHLTDALLFKLTYG